jgi:anti-sigma B factor antagonist
MFTRRAVFQIKAGQSAEFKRIVEGEVLPPLRSQPGCRHEEAFVTPALSEAVLNSYWDTQECAEAYSRAAYPAALVALAEVSEGAPTVETFDISSATFHRLTAPRRKAYRASTFGRGGWTPAPHAPRPTPRQEEPAMVNCKINERRLGAVTVLDLIGELRAGGSRAALHAAIGRLSGEGRNQILLNLAGLSAIDASGLGELLQSNVGLNKGGGQLKLLHPARALREMMSITKLSGVFDMFESESEAVAAFAKPILDSEGQLLSYEYARYETRS